MKPMHLMRPSLAASAVLLCTSAVTADPAAPGNDFDRLAADLDKFDRLDLLRGGSGAPVVFDSDAARAHGLSDDAIQLGQQLAAQTNEIVNQMDEAEQRDRPPALGLNMDARPELKNFLAEASKRSLVQPSSADQDSEVGPQEFLSARRICGSYSKPKPSSAAEWRTYWSADPASRARTLGYHLAPKYAGGGWTRPQTYQPKYCKNNTFRDHATVVYPYFLREQNYSGSPGGEPNPEVKKLKWPYPDWPVYVAWWHRKF